ncbi:MAG: peptidylprolyl isomerase [Luteibaculum sp.]
MEVSKLPFIGVFFLLLLWSCGSEQEATAPSKIETKEEKQIAPVEKAFYLNNDNAPDYLANYFNENPERQVLIKTKYGEIILRLSEKTPIHSGNFLYLIKEKDYYDSTLFYRVAEDFLIQGGDADNFLISNRKYGIGEYALPMELDEELYHKPGALAMCRHYDNSNEGLSTSFDFYIVIGEKSTELQLQQLEREHNIRFSPDQRKTYKTIGGTPHLDGEHTVFGEVLSGMDVVKKISMQPTDSQDWPDENIFIEAEIIS